ncbi:MAG: hypothetical protein ACTS4U_00070 [Candidatus Hodgkinia cicadicola]
MNVCVCEWERYVWERKVRKARKEYERKSEKWGNIGEEEGREKGRGKSERKEREVEIEIEGKRDR